MGGQRVVPYNDCNRSQREEDISFNLDCEQNFHLVTEDNISDFARPVTVGDIKKTYSQDNFSRRFGKDST